MYINHNKKKNIITKEIGFFIKYYLFKSLNVNIPNA